MILPILWILVGVALLGFYNGLLLLDDKTPEEAPNNKKIETQWHFVGALIFIYLSATASYFWGIKYLPIALSSFWLIYAGIVHRIGLNRPIFYVGTTAKTDKIIRSIFPKNPEMGCLILKSIAFVSSVLLLILF